MTNKLYETNEKLAMHLIRDEYKVSQRTALLQAKHLSRKSACVQLLIALNAYKTRTKITPHVIIRKADNHKGILFFKITLPDLRECRLFSTAKMRQPFTRIARDRSPFDRFLRSTHCCH